MGKASQIDLEIVREAAQVLGLAVGGGPPLSTLNTDTILLQLLEDGRLLASVRNTSLLATHLSLDAGVLPMQLARFAPDSAIVTDPEGVLVASARSAAELDALAGARSSPPLQEQIDALIVSGGGLAGVSDTATIDLTVAAGVVSADVRSASLDNTHLKASAAILYSQLAALTADRALVSGPTGVVAASARSAAELDALAGARSSPPLQAQIDALGVGLSGVTDTATIDLTLAGGMLSGVVPFGSLGSTHLGANAGVLYSQLAALTADRALVSGPTGVVTVSGRSAAELDALAGARSSPALQAQIDAIGAQPRVTFTSQTFIEIPIPAAWEQMRIDLRCNPATDDVMLFGRAVLDGGLGLVTTASYDYTGTINYGTSVSPFGGNVGGVAQWYFIIDFSTAGNGVGNVAATEGVWGWIRIEKKSSPPTIQWQLAYRDTASRPRQSVGMGGLPNFAQSMTALRLFFEGNAAFSGNYSVSLIS